MPPCPVSYAYADLQPTMFASEVQLSHVKFRPHCLFTGHPVETIHRAGLPCQCATPRCSYNLSSNVMDADEEIRSRRLLSISASNHLPNVVPVLTASKLRLT